MTGTHTSQKTPSPSPSPGISHEGKRGICAKRPCASAFTLVEIMVVLSIMIIILAVGMPVWHALTGNNSVAAAQNQIAAALANARGDAIYHRQTIGVLFFIDPVNDQTAMAEVEAQTLYQIPYTPATSPPSTIYTNTALFQPQDGPGGNIDNGAVYSLERVNYPDPNNPPVTPGQPGNYIFYRDIILLPKGVGVALNCDTYTYNQFGVFGTNAASYPPGGLDRFRRLGCIMFAPDGTLTSLPFGIPYHEMFDASYTKSPSMVANKPFGTINLVCSRLQFPNVLAVAAAFDIGSRAKSPGTTALPLRSSQGFVIFDRDAYKSQRCQANVATNGGGTPTAQVEGDPIPFNEYDLNYNLYSASAGGEVNAMNVPGETITNPAADKFIEEQWIDQNGLALLVSPFNGELIKAK